MQLLLLLLECSYLDQTLQVLSSVFLGSNIVFLFCLFTSDNNIVQASMFLSRGDLRRELHRRYSYALSLIARDYLLPPGAGVSPLFPPARIHLCVASGALRFLCAPPFPYLFTSENGDVQQKDRRPRAMQPRCTPITMKSSALHALP